MSYDCRICGHPWLIHAEDEAECKVVRKMPCAALINVDLPLICACEDFCSAEDNLKYMEIMYDRKAKYVPSVVQ